MASAVCGLGQRRAYTLTEAAALFGVSYHSLYRAAIRNDLKLIRGFGRMMISDAELNRLLETQEYKPLKPRRAR
jgi:hypothetical protein